MGPGNHPRFCNVLLGGHVQCREQLGRWVSSLDDRRQEPGIPELAR